MYTYVSSVLYMYMRYQTHRRVVSKMGGRRGRVVYIFKIRANPFGTVYLEKIAHNYVYPGDTYI